ncbi:MAG: selenoneine biosynthesis selenosugar synthase SenB [Burkholderiales bacterium]
MHRASIVIVTPALADANNGNWQTARRWARMLAGAYRVTLVDRWTGSGAGLMIALHARRSAGSIAAWRAACPDGPLLVVLTGTDLYRDIDADPDARRSLDSADALVALNALGPARLAPPHRAKARVVLQSCTARRPLPKSPRRLRALMVGHLRAEKDPDTYLEAARRLADRPDILLDHVGGALDPAIGARAAALAAALPTYRWLGARPHAEVRRRIQAAHVLVHASRMEGGAHVVIEAVRSGTPVIGSRIDGNAGLLGEDYGGWFPVGDAGALAAMLVRARDDPAWLAALRARCDARAPDFAPDAEAASLRAIVAGLLAGASTGR